MSISFEDYCEDYLDLCIGLMSQKDLNECRAAYSDFLKDDRHENAAEAQKHQSALAKAKESRKLAKFYGGKALKGSAKQKKWAEDIRQKALESSSLSDEQKSQLVTIGSFVDSAKFWIDNRFKDASLFDAKFIVSETRKLLALRDKHYDTLARTCATHEKNAARKEIHDALSSCPFFIKIEFPNCDFYDANGSLIVA